LHDDTVRGTLKPMSAQIVVSLLTAAVALVSIYLSARASRGTARLTYELDMAKARATKEQMVEELMSRYREPLLRAAFDLQSRIYNIIKQGFLVRYGAEGRPHEREYARDNTVFLFAEYFGWVEILRRDVQFLDVGDVERNHLLVQRLEHISDAFATDRLIGDPTFRVFRGKQRALGELMIDETRTVDGRRQCVGYAQFHTRLRSDAAFAEWFQPLCEDVSNLTSDGAHNYDRLTALQHALIDLITFLDDPPRRFMREQCTKL
jgi:hypothetical protein